MKQSPSRHFSVGATSAPSVSQWYRQLTAATLKLGFYDQVFLQRFLQSLWRGWFLNLGTTSVSSDMFPRYDWAPSADEVALESESRTIPLKNENKKLFNELVTVKGILV